MALNKKNEWLNCIRILGNSRGRNDNPLLQQHLLIPFTFNKAVEKVDYNKESFQTDPLPKASIKPTLKQLADEYQVCRYLKKHFTKLMKFKKVILFLHLI